MARVGPQCVSGAGRAVGDGWVMAHCAPVFHSFRQPPVHLVHLPFTFHACGLLASNWFSRDKTPVCVTTMLVRVVTLFALQQDFLPECFRWYCNE